MSTTGFVPDTTEDKCRKLEQEAEKLQAQVAMLRDWFMKDNNCTCDTCWSCAGKGAAVLSETASSDAWMKEHDAKLLESASDSDLLDDDYPGTEHCREILRRMASELRSPESDVDQDTRMA